MPGQKALYCDDKGYQKYVYFRPDISIFTYN